MANSCVTAGVKDVPRLDFEWALQIKFEWKMLCHVKFLNNVRKVKSDKICNVNVVEREKERKRERKREREKERKREKEKKRERELRASELETLSQCSYW